MKIITDHEVAKVASPNRAFTFHIRIVGAEVRGIAGITVKVWYKPGFLGVISWYPDTITTDDDGWAHFNKPARFERMTGEQVTMDIRIGDVLLAEDVTVKDGETLCYTLTPKCERNLTESATDSHLPLAVNQ